MARSNQNTRSRMAWGLALILLLVGGAMFLHGFVQDLPYQLEPDEPNIWLRVNALATTGKLISFYPPLGLIEQALEHRLLYLVTPKDQLAQPIYYVFGRYMSVLYSVLLLAISYQAGRMVYGPAAGLATSVFLIAHRNLIDMTRLLKTDNVAWLFGMLAFFAAFYALRSGKRRWVWFSALGAVFAIAGKYTMAPIVLAPLVAGIIVLPRTGRDRLIVLLVSLVLAAAGLLIVLNPPTFIADFMLSFHARQLYQRDSVIQFVSLDRGWQGLRDQLTPLYMLGVSALLIGGLFIWPRPRLSWSQWTMLAILVATMLFTFLGMGLFETNRDQDRYLIVLAFALMWGVSIALITGRRSTWALALAVIATTPSLVSGWQSGANQRRPDTRVLTAEYFIDNVPEGTHLAAEYDAVEFERGYGGFPSEKIFFVELITSVHDETIEDYARRGIEYLVADYRNINRGGFFDTVGDDDAFLAQVEMLVAVENPQAVGMKGPARYIFRVPPIEQNPAHIFLGDSVIFKGYDLADTELAPGDTLDLVLYWAALREMDANYTVFAQIIGPDGELLAQNDGLPGDALHRTYDWWAGYFDWDEWPVTIPADAPPGDYRLVLGMYDADTLVRLPAVDADGTPLGDHIELTTLTITP